MPPGQTDHVALSPQVLAEFIHVVTDPRRFGAPLSIAAAVERAGVWWNSAEVVQVFPSSEGTRVFLEWLREHQLGRERLLDAMLASTFRANGIISILTLDAGDFKVLGGFSFPR